MKALTHAAVEQYNKKIAAGKHGFLIHHRSSDYGIISVDLHIPIDEATARTPKFLTFSILGHIREQLGHRVEAYNTSISDSKCSFIQRLTCKSHVYVHIYHMHLLVQVPTARAHA